MQDITDRKQAEMSLRESEERFRTLVDSLPILVWILDQEGKPTFVNQTWQEFTGLSLEEASNGHWIEKIHSDDRPTFMSQVATAQAERTNIFTEFRFARHDGEYRHLLNIGVPRTFPDSTFLGYVGASIDITEQKNLQAQLIESQKLESLGRLAGGIAHDFNNLLTAISGYTQLAQENIPPDTEEAGFLSNVSIASERASALTEQLLMYARRQMVDYTIVNLNEIIHRMDSLLRRTIGEAYELVLGLGENIGNVYANASQMEQVLLNLVVNARDAMPTGGRIVIESANVLLDADYALSHVGVPPGEYVMFSVSDNGIGMTKEVQEHVFEPFFTTKEVHKGTGLGLATCYGIVKQSKGNIWVYSEPGIGTTFKVYLPSVREFPAQKVEGARPDELTGAETVLVVDDEPMVRDIAIRILRSHGYQTLDADSGSEALRLCQEWAGQIDLLLTDVVMPLMSGKELALRLREMWPGLHVLYMSGYTQNVIVQQGVLESDVALISKPFSSEVLLKKIREMLNAHAR